MFLTRWAIIPLLVLFLSVQNFLCMIRSSLSLSIALSLSSSFGYSQNLVLNPSFEAGGVCDGTTERIETVNNWSPISGQPSYINTQCPLSKDAKSFVLGMRLPAASHGDVHTIQKFDREAEAQQGQLSQPLEAGASYIVSVRVRLPIQFCQEPINEVGVAFNTEPFKVTEDRRVLTETALGLTTNTNTPISAQYRWEEVSALYIAKGGERYLAIGNFANNNAGVFENRAEKACTYLFIDAVAVRPFKAVALPYYSANGIKLQERTLLKGVDFSPQSLVLSPEAKTALLPLVEHLQEHETARATLSVYMNNNLDATESLTLSKARATSIEHYLLDKGIPKERFEVVGLGDSQAIALNNTEEGRRKNERVEVVFTAL